MEILTTMPAGRKQTEYVQLKKLKDSVKRNKLNNKLQLRNTLSSVLQQFRRFHSSWHKPFAIANQSSCCQGYSSKSQINNSAAWHLHIHALIIKQTILKTFIIVNIRRNDTDVINVTAEALMKTESYPPFDSSLH